MSKQTAIEYLVHELHASGFIEDITDQLLIQRVNEAKAMQQEQIVEAWHDGHSPYGHMFVGHFLKNKYGKEAGHEA